MLTIGISISRDRMGAVALDGTGPSARVAAVAEHACAEPFGNAEDAAALARAIECVLSDGSSAAARAVAARRLVEERFSHAAAVTRLLALYDEVIAGAGPNPVRA